MQINIIAPMYNEAGNVKQLLVELDKTCEQYKDINFKFVFVNDGSKDNTHEEILKLPDERIKYIKFSRNFGKEAAMIAGLEYSKDAAACVIIDSDLQMPLHHIHEMIKIWQGGTKLIICRKSNRNVSKLKGKLASKFYDVYAKATGYDIVPDALDYTFLDKQVVHEVVKNQASNRFFKGIIASIGFDYKVLDIEIIDRTSGESSYASFSQLFKYAIVSIAIDTKLPLYAALYIGLAALLISFILTMITIYNYFFVGVEVSGYSSLMCVTLFFSGMILLIQGVKGFYLGLVLDEAKQRPLYIIDEVYEK